MKIIFLGVQGSGKSTQAKMLADQLNLPFLEMGQLFRDKASEEGESGAKIKQALSTGNLVDDEIVVKTLQEELTNTKYKDGFILDGYPRNEAQLEGLTQTIDKVFYIKVTDNEALKRLILRKREDDTEELLKKRLEIYHEKTEPLLSFFRKHEILVEIDGEQTIEEVNKSVLEKLDAK